MLRTLLAATVLLGPAASLRAQSQDWSLQDRVVVGDFTRITSIATSSDRVFATSPSALLIWNPNFRQWEGPIIPRAPVSLDRVFAALVDPLDNSLWLGRTDGWVHYEPSIQLWEQGLVPGAVQEIAFDLNNPLNGLLLRTGGGWFAVTHGSGIAVPSMPPSRPLRPATVNDAVRANPAIQANSSAILLDNRLRNARYTAAASGFAGRGWYLGTWGVGLMFLPDGAALPERLTFGLPGSSVGALYAAPGGVWVVTQRTATDDPAISFLSSDLNEFRWFQGNRATGLPFTEARKLVGRGAYLWAGTDQGLLRIDPVDGRTDLVDEGRRLPDRRVLDVASRRGRMAVATAHGVASIDDSLLVTRLAPGFSNAALAVAISGDTTWVGTSLGVYFTLPDLNDPVRPARIGESAELQAPALGFTWLADTLVVLTPDRLMWRNPTTGAWSLSPLLSGLLGRLRVMTPVRDGVYVGGDRGMAFARLDTPSIRPLFVPGDVPGAVNDLAADDTYLWVGTGNGLVRWRLSAILP